MKFKFVFVGLLVGCLRAVGASDEYVNDGVVLCPPAIAPQVDAINFVNNNYFSVNFATFQPQPYITSSTRRYTNNGIMIANSGFRFDTEPAISGAPYMADYFVNRGTVMAGSALNTNTLFSNFLFTAGWPRYQISATNVILRSSTNITGVDGLFSLRGKQVDLNRANISMEGFEENPDSLTAIIDMVGMTAAYWGVSTNVMNPVANLEGSPVTSPFTLVTTGGAGLGFQFLSLPNATFYFTSSTIGTNREFRGVFVNNTNAAIINKVYFPSLSTTMVEWNGFYTNPVSGVITSNRMYLTDTSGSFATNFLLANFSYYSLLGTAIPANYNFTRYNPFFFPQTPAAPASSAGRFDSLIVTNECTAFGAVFSPTTFNLASLPPSGRYITNMAGRIEITADANLDLTGARISGLNYLSLKATNHLVSSAGAKIASPFSDVNLATTNGSLTISNLLAPVVQRFNGSVDLWTGRWTNDGAGLRTRYVVLLVDSKLAPTAPAVVEHLTLRSTNVYIGDIMNVTSNLLIDAQRLTIISNQPPAPTAAGELNLLSSSVTWSSALPRLQFLTNHGAIKTLNAVFFGGARTSPYYSSNFNESYEAFVNRGSVTSEGSLIWARYFENSGQFSTGLGYGSIQLQALNARLTDGSFMALNGEVSISSGNIVVTNHLLRSGRALTLTATNLLTDLVATAPSVLPFTNANNWSVGDGSAVGGGVNLPVKPATGDLLGTVIYNKAKPGAEVTHLWAAEDRGGDNSIGYSNNAAIGKMILDGGDIDSLFTFNGAGVSNAIYIDSLELRNYTTNIDAGGNLSEINVAPNMVIYYAQATVGNISVAERINHANGDRLRWVFNHAGNFSAAALVYPDGTTNFFNAALVQSQNIDSDGDGLVNAVDPTPILRAQDLAVTVAISVQPTPGAVISWNTVPDSANTIYYKSSSGIGGWQVLTNLSVGPFTSGRISIIDPITTNGARYYRVMMAPPQP